MQWSPDRNAGFSRTDPARLFLPPIMDPVYGYEAVNVEAQSRNPTSLLNWMRRLIGVRKSYRAFGRGTLQFLRPGNRKILAYLRQYEEEIILCVANLSRNPQPVELDLAKFKGLVPLELVGRTAFPPIGELPYLLTLPGYGFYGFSLNKNEQVPSWHTEVIARDELPVLVLVEGWGTVLTGKAAQNDVRRITAQRTRAQIEKDILPHYLHQQRWFAGKGRKIESVALRTLGELDEDGGRRLLNFIDVAFADGETHSYFLPLAIVWEEPDSDEQLRKLGAWTLAKVRQKARMGLLIDALRDDDVVRGVVRAMGQNAAVPLSHGRVRFASTRLFPMHARALQGEINRPALDQSNTSLSLGNELFLKVYRRAQPGSNPELEIGRFLTETSPFLHTVPVVGAVEYEQDDGTVFTLALLQRYVPNQGSVWSYTQDYLERYFETCSSEAGCEMPPEGGSPHAAYFALIHLLGVRTAELHKALAMPTVDPNFGQEPVLRGDVEHWCGQVRNEMLETVKLLESRIDDVPEEARMSAHALLEQRGMLLSRCDPAQLLRIHAVKIRYHGDYHLGQVLLANNDFLIVDFEGEPTRPLAERRARHTPLKDVAGMLRSFSYAAAAAVKRGHPQRPEQIAALKSVASDWRHGASDAFLKGYRETVDANPIYPTNETHARRLRDLLLLEKVMYEIRYELNNRPQWIDIPLQGALELLEVVKIGHGGE
jgi:maltose alpha-D-glucosyltransferase/alpha-amylase